MRENFMYGLMRGRRSDPPLYSTLKSEGQAMVKNVKLLKKYLNKLTVTIAYPPKGFKFHLLSNISDEIRSILGD
jgi:hypothetical protein